MATTPDAPPVLRVDALERAAEGVLAVTLADPDGGRLAPWEPGAHVDLHLAPGLVRPYSLCSDPADPSRYRVGVLRVPDSRGGSARVHEVLRPGHTLPVSRPRNTFRLADAERYLLVAGGIGITPLLPMAHRLTALGRPWKMLYGGRSRASMAFLGELPADAVTVVPEDEAGRPDLASFLASWPDAAAYACGPGGLLDAVRALHTGPVHTERFAPAGGPPQDGPGAGGPADFALRLERSGLDLVVPADRSVLETVRAAGVEADSSCELGICGACETKVLDGVPDHRDDLLTEAERASGGTMMICVSRCAGERLVLDL
ncbi:PDR/VanB family oxidoreductase [Streptomyces sp. LHD-70]|uniref:PDR/VanB family oxidoreductase n=1 Tax=Streptomyces sp. LHD-70 TaxID=3072140 RepID=UPI00280F26F3|nr:PDR/VanB family oxidoreductase [Streptomyces sp. LHD-70]MDQ8702588.1 PDR/VanB family oxidoreductase [Streptomyces sp. LHD-70]